jgi:hypothetical protein
MTFHKSGPPPTEKRPPHQTTPSKYIIRRSISQPDPRVNPPSAQNDSRESQNGPYRSESIDLATEYYFAKIAFCVGAESLLRVALKSRGVEFAALCMRMPGGGPGLMHPPLIRQEVEDE